MVPMYSGPSFPRAGSPSRSLTRCCTRAASDAAAFSVNVNETIASGSIPSSRRKTILCATTSVFPEPAEAMICTLPPRWMTASRASPSSFGVAIGLAILGSQSAEPLDDLIVIAVGRSSDGFD
jgi:hypothetical protein